MFLIAIISNAQTIDSTTIINSDGSTTTTKTTTTSVKKERTPFFRKKGVRTMLAPAILIGWGVSTIHGNGLYSSYRCSTDIARIGFSPNFAQIDDYVVFVPYVGLVALNLVNIKCKDDFINTSLLIGKSTLLTWGVVSALKYSTHIERPDRNPNDKNRYYSFPSGHTAMAFVAATIFHQEFKHHSVWYSVAGYTVATSVGALRMIHNRHWESDVFVGAGIGMLCTNLVYLTHKYKWGRACEFTMAPIYYKGAVGLSFAKPF